MGETPIMEPIKEDKLRGMGGIISATVDYRNYPGALGFAFRYYANELVKDNYFDFLVPAERLFEGHNKGDENEKRLWREDQALSDAGVDDRDL